jgi:hypothetical protein
MRSASPDSGTWFQPAGRSPGNSPRWPGGQPGRGDAPPAYHRDAAGFQGPDTLQMAQQVLDVADTQAAGITQAAWDQANAIRDAAERDAAAVRQQAISQAAGMIEAAQREAAQTRAATQQLSDELARVAAYVIQNLTLPPDVWTAPPAAFPAAPADIPPGPGARPTATRPVAPVPAPRPRPASPRPARPRPGPPDARPAAKPAGRQAKAARKMTAALAVLVLAGVVSGGTEVALHGLPFFAFRANGAGASVTGLDEDQGPGQPDAPGAHHKTAAPTATPAPRPTPAHRR